MKASDLFKNQEDLNKVKNICQMFNGRVVMCSTDGEIAYHNDPEGFAVKFNLHYNYDYVILYIERDNQ